MMSELGIFIDESGVFEAKNGNLKDLYIVSFLFHNKAMSIDNDVMEFERFLIENNFNPAIPIHSMPLIRQQKPYKDLNREKRRKLFNHLFHFMKKLNLKHKVFVYDKGKSPSKQSIKQNLETYINKMILDNFDYFNKFNEIVIYYDEGQDYLSKILHNAFSKTMNNCRFKEEVTQGEYRLLQCADLVCSLELIKQRKQNNEYIKSIEKFFPSGSKLNKNYLKVYNNLEL